MEPVFLLGKQANAVVAFGCYIRIV